MSRIYSLYLQDIVDASERIASYVKDVTHSEANNSIREMVDQIFDAFKANSEYHNDKRMLRTPL